MLFGILKMKKVTREVIKESAEKLMFKLSEEEIENLVEEFDIIVKQMELIGDIPGVDDVEPMTFPFDVTNTFLREDVASRPVERDELLKNASDVKDGQIKLPKVVK